MFHFHVVATYSIFELKIARYNFVKLLCAIFIILGAVGYGHTFCDSTAYNYSSLNYLLGSSGFILSPANPQSSTDNYDIDKAVCELTLGIQGAQSLIDIIYPEEDCDTPVYAIYDGNNGDISDIGLTTCPTIGSSKYHRWTAFVEVNMKIRLQQQSGAAFNLSVTSELKMVVETIISDVKKVPFRIWN